MLGPEVDVTAQLRNGEAGISVRQLVLQHPRLEATGMLVQTARSTYLFEAQAANADLAALQTVARGIAPDVTLLAQHALRIERGTLTSLTVSSEAATLAGLLRPEALDAQFAVDAIDAFAAEYALHIREAGASGSFHAGKLEVRGATARIGKSVVREVNVATTLGAEPMSLSADVRLSLDLAEGLALAKRVIRNPAARQELDRIKQLTGHADVQARVTPGRQKPDVRVDAHIGNLSARHSAVPLPIRIENGDLRYVKDALYMQKLEGAVGHSTFKGVAARLGLNAPYPLSESSGSAQLVLDELVHWAAKQPALPKHLDGIERVAGTITVSLSKLEGPLRSPEKIRYRLAASPNGVAIDAPKFGPRLALDGGTIDISDTSIRIRDVKVSTPDSSLRVGGDTGNYRNGPRGFRITLDGSAGLASLEWMRIRAGLPESLRLRSPLQFSGFTAQWSPDGELTARGKVQVTGGPAIGFAIRRSRGRIEVADATLRDELSDVKFDGSLEDTRFDLRFKGRLAGRSIARIFTDLPLELGELSGDLQAKGDWTHPDLTSARGVL